MKDHFRSHQALPPARSRQIRSGQLSPSARKNSSDESPSEKRDVGPIHRSALSLVGSTDPKRTVLLLGLLMLCAGVVSPLLSEKITALPLISFSQPLIIVGCMIVGATALLQRKTWSFMQTRLLLALGFLASALWPFFTGPVDYPASDGPWLAGFVVAAVLTFASPIVEIRDLRLILNVLAAVSLATVLFGADAFSTDERTGIFDFGRLTGAFGHPNITGMVAVLGLALSIEGRWRKPGIILNGMVVLASVSLTSLVALAAVLVVRFVPSPGITRAIRWLSASAYILPALAVVTIGDTLSPDLFTGRVGAWQWALAQTSLPMDDRGPALFDSLHNEYLIPWVHAHNELMMDWATLGGLFALLHLAMFGLLFFYVSRTTNNIATYSFIALALSSFSEIPFYLDYPSGRMLGTVIEIMAILITRQKVSRESTTFPKQQAGPNGVYT